MDECRRTYRVACTAESGDINEWCVRTQITEGEEEEWFQAKKSLTDSGDSEALDHAQVPTKIWGVCSSHTPTLTQTIT